jgi:hypothetical protein
MFRKLSPLVLFALLAVLLIAVVFILRIDARKQQGSFLRELVNVDRQKTTSIVVIPKGMAENAITLERKEDRWMVGSQGKTFQANRQIIDELFRVISPMVPEQLVSRNQENWAEYETNEESGTRVKLYEGSKLADDFIVGRFSIQQQMMQGQQQPKISTFVRLTGQDDVYAVDGFLGSVFPQSITQYRDQAVVNARAEDIEKISVQGDGNYNYELLREGADWVINGMPADSATMDLYIDVLGWISSNAFVEEEAEGWTTIPSHKMVISRKTAQPIEITAYPADTIHRYFIITSQNPGAVFSGSRNDLFETIFHPQDYFAGNR